MSENSTDDLGDRLIDLLGKSEKEPLCKKFFTDYVTEHDFTVGNIRMSMFPEHGFTIIFNFDDTPSPLICNTIQVFLDLNFFPGMRATPAYSNYSSSLPFGLTLEDTDQSIQRKLAMEPTQTIDAHIKPEQFSLCYYLNPCAVSFTICKESRRLVGLIGGYSEHDPWTQPENPDLSSCIRFPIERVKKND